MPGYFSQTTIIPPKLADQKETKLGEREIRKQIELTIAIMDVQRLERGKTMCDFVKRHYAHVFPECVSFDDGFVHWGTRSG